MCPHKHTKVLWLGWEDRMFRVWDVPTSANIWIKPPNAWQEGWDFLERKETVISMPKWINHVYHAHLSSCRRLGNSGGANATFAVRWLFIVCKLELKNLFPVFRSDQHEEHQPGQTWLPPQHGWILLHTCMNSSSRKLLNWLVSKKKIKDAS